MSNQTRRRYDRQFKLEAVRLSYEPGRSVSGGAPAISSAGSNTVIPKEPLMPLMKPGI